MKIVKTIVFFLFLTLNVKAQLIHEFTLRPVSDFTGFSVSTRCEKPRILGFIPVSIPDETFTGSNRYKEPGSRNGFPYTMFNKRRPNETRDWYADNKQTVENEVEKLRLAICYTPELMKIYKEIFSYASLSLYNARGSEDLDMDQTPSTLARWAKCNAFVYLINMDTLPGTCMQYLDDYKRNAYSLNVEMAFMEMDTRVAEAPYNGFSSPLSGLQHHSKSLIMWLQAYDLMKAARYKYLYDFADNVEPRDEDRNSCECSMRDKLRMYTRNFYRACDGGSFGLINNKYGWKRNHGLMAAGTLAMAAVVLNDASVKWWWPSFKPENWAELAHYGIKDNMFDGKLATIFYSVPMSERNKISGYAEGPRYFEFCMENLLPAFRALANFIPDKNSEQNYLYSPDYHNLFKWYESILLPDGRIPTYDNSGVSRYTALLALMGGPENNTYNTHYNGFIGEGIDLRVDYLLAMMPIAPPKHDDKVTILPNAGNNIIRQTDSKKNKHYFHMLTESGVADEDGEVTLPPATPNSSQYDINIDTHEDKDMGSFSIAVNTTHLVIDPPYFGWSEVKKTNKYEDHNIIHLMNGTTPVATKYTNPVVSESKAGMGINASYTGYDENMNPKGQITREVRTYETAGQFYYMLNDKIHQTNGSTGIFWSLNGNGSILTNPSTFTYGNQVTSWSNGCRFIDTFVYGGLLSHSAFLDALSHGVTPNPKTELSGSNATLNKGITNDNVHSRIEFFQQKPATLIQTMLMPYECSKNFDGSASWPGITRKELADYVTTTLLFKNAVDTTFILGKQPDPSSIIQDTILDFHMARMSADSTLITNPFGLQNDTLVDMKTDALKLYAQYETYGRQRLGHCSDCESIVNIRKVEMEQGKKFTYNDTTFIECNNVVDVGYNFKRLLKYAGFINATSTTHVKFFIKEAKYGIPLTIIGDNGLTISSIQHNAYDSTRYYIEADFIGSGKFTIDVADPCLLSCFFPPATQDIDTLFDFHTGTLEYLGHNLEILRGDGNLKISNNSRMNICSNFILVNKDSIIMGDSCQPDKQWTYVYDETGPQKINLPPDSLKYLCDKEVLIENRKEATHRNMIIVNDKAALVLDSGSITKIGNGSTILIKEGGTLLVKSGARVIIGDTGCFQSRGELLTDHGSFVCIEDGAELIFVNDIDTLRGRRDSLDRHIVYISITGADAGEVGTYSGVNELGGGGEFTSGGTWANNTCIDICSWKSRTPVIGVKNEPFGWCNINSPYAFFTTKSMLCLGEPAFIDATESLNEVEYIIKAYEYDTSTHIPGAQKASINMKDSFCLGNIYVFTPANSGHYLIRLIVINDCNERDTFDKIIYAPPFPVANFTVPDSICPGYSTLLADGSSSFNGLPFIWHKWSVSLIMDDSTWIKTGEEFESELSWRIDSVPSVSDSFAFEGFRFAGNSKYLISLLVKGYCSDSSFYDTVFVPLSTKIDASIVSNYNNPVGPAAFQLNGQVTGASSFSWNPTNYLDDPYSLTTVAMPDQPYSYVLEATDGTCFDRDTIEIQHNDIAYAGEDKETCMGNALVLGTDYNGFSILALMYYLNSDGVSNGFDTYEATLDIPTYFSHFMLRDYNSYSNSVTDQFKDDTLLRRYLIQMPAYSNAFRKFYLPNQTANALNDMFAAISGDSWLSGYISGSGYAITNQECVDLFDAFNSWYDPGNFYEITWESKKLKDTSWTENTNWKDNFNRYSADSITHKHRITINDNVNSILEYDEVMLTRDTIIKIAFEPDFIVDSTVWFTNACNPVSNKTSFYWNFGDGGTSTLRNPSHTFVSKDSTYIICLTAVNECDSFTYCDTLTLDSLGMLFTYGKKGNDPVNIPSSIEAKSTLANLIKSENKLYVNRPNPFSDKTVVEYELKEGYHDAEIRISNTLGQSLKVLKLKGVRGHTIVDGSQWKNGMYFYSLVVNGIIISSNIMVIEK